MPTKTHKIVIISSSVRIDRKSHRVALFFQKYIKKNKLATVSMVDLNEYNFPIFEERLRFMKKPSAALKKYAKEIEKADGIIIISPEYNGGIPASLKNAIDVLYPEFYRKPIAISTVSSGNFAGSQVQFALATVLWKMKALLVPGVFPVANIEKSFDENGVPSDLEATEKRAKLFLDELNWCIEKVKN